MSGRWLCRGTSLVAIAAAALACRAQLAARAATPGKPSEAPPIVELASHENLLYARRANGRLHRWDTATGDTRLFEQEGFVAIAPDGSVAVTHKKLEPRGSRVEVWDLATERLLRTRVFEHGVDRFLVAHGTVFLVESDPPRPPAPPMPPRSIVELPSVDTTLWSLQTDQVRKVRGFDPYPNKGCRFSPAGLRLACANWLGLSWRDLDHSQWGGSIALAPEWKEPRTDIALTYGSKPQAEPSWTSWESLAWTGDGHRIVVAYAKAGDPPECRIERQTPGDKVEAGKGSERLVTVHRRCNINVLAASRDGNRFVTSEFPSRLMLRQAPKYEAIEIAPVDATQAAFLSGDARFVTVHRDGLQLWDARTLRLLARWP